MLNKTLMFKVRWMVLAGLLCVSTAYGAEKPFVLAELFSSEGCSSCPPADDLLIALHEEAKQKDQRIYVLSFQVDYWDYLGWKDPLSNPQFTQRQHQYARVLRSRSVYTPQMIINGQYAFVGSDARQLRAYVAQVFSEHVKAPVLKMRVEKKRSDVVEVAFSIDHADKDMTLHAALVENEITHRVNAGENAGRTLRHVQAVRQFKSINAEPQGVIELEQPQAKGDGRFSVILFVQRSTDMKILDVQQADLE